MSGMVERVARALFANRDEFDARNSSEHPAFEHNRDYWEGQARAAIEAMREPTDEMCEAGANIVWDYAEFVGAKDLVKRVQIGMTDAALSPAKED